MATVGHIRKHVLPIAQKPFVIETLTIQVKEARPQGYETFFMLNSAEHVIYPAHKC